MKQELQKYILKINEKFPGRPNYQIYEKQGNSEEYILYEQFTNIKYAKSILRKLNKSIY